MKCSTKYLFIAAEEKGETYELDPLEIPRRRCPPKRYADQVAQHQPANPEEHYRKQYLEFIDAVSKGLSDRYDLSKSGLAQYMKLENMLTSGKVDLDVISKYPELDKCSLQMQLEMFKQNYKPDTLNDAKLSYRSMTPEVRSLFPQVAVLLKLLLVCPVSSCECERSFSALRYVSLQKFASFRVTILEPLLYNRKITKIFLIKDIEDLFSGCSEEVAHLIKSFSLRKQDWVHSPSY